VALVNRGWILKALQPILLPWASTSSRRKRKAAVSAWDAIDCQGLMGPLTSWDATLSIPVRGSWLWRCPLSGVVSIDRRNTLVLVAKMECGHESWPHLSEQLSRCALGEVSALG